MTLRICKSCGKFMTAKVKSCVFCGGAVRKKMQFSMWHAIIIFMISGIAVSATVFNAEIKEAYLKFTSNKQKDNQPEAITSVAPRVIEKKIDDKKVTPSKPETKVAVKQESKANKMDAKALEKIREAIAEKFISPTAGKTVSIKLNSGRKIKGTLKTITKEEVKLQIASKIRSYKREDLDERTRLRFFKNDFVDYFSQRELKQITKN